MDSLYTFFKNAISPASSLYTVVFLWPPTFTTTVFPNCLCWLSNCLFALRFLEKLSSALWCISLRNSGTKQPHYHTIILYIHTYTRTCDPLSENQTRNRYVNVYIDVYIDVPISGLILIFIKCRMCRVFTQRVTYMYLCIICMYVCMCVETHWGTQSHVFHKTPDCHDQPSNIKQSPPFIQFHFKTPSLFMWCPL